MQIKKILFPSDFSTSSDAGLAYATALARDMKASLVIAHVEEPPLAYAGGEMYYGMPEPNLEAIDAMLRAVKPSDPSVPFTHKLVTGEPASEIVRLAKEEGVDLIVLGTHGRTGLSRLLMGSVAEAVVRSAECPVLTFKAPATSRPA